MKTEKQKQICDRCTDLLSLDPTDAEFPALVVLIITPTLDPRGVQFMHFPLTMKCTCIAHENHTSSLQNAIDMVEFIDRNLVYTRKKYTNNFVFKKLTDKLWRAAFLRDSGILGVLWDQNTGMSVVVYLYV
jgi:hypothetical protein